MRNDFCHLHVHTEYSQLDGMGTVEQYAKEAKRIGHKYLAITDHGNIDGLIKFQQACKKHGVKPILGCELYILPKGDEKSKIRGHMCVWVKNETGFKNLCRLLTNANENFYYKPRVDQDYFLENCEGLCASTACLISFARVLPNGPSFFEKVYDVLKDDLYVEVMPHDIKKQIRWNAQAIRIANHYNLKVIATNDTHYVKRRDYRAQEVLLAIQRKAKMSDENRFKFSTTGFYMKKAEEMTATFKKNGHRFNPRWLTNTMLVAEKCSGFTIPQQEIALPRVPGVPINPSKARKFLWELCEKGFDEKVGKTRTLYFNRLKEEYNLIIKKKFERYFFIVWEVINWCKENGILVGPGRGSVGGSLMAYLLGITAVDPIRHNLLFSRFINEDRIDYPDIDIDFEDRKRHLVRKHLETIYGVEKVAGVSSFNRMKAKAVMKDVGRCFDIHWSETDAFTKLIEDNDDHTGIQDAINEYPECRDYQRAHPEVVRFARSLEGQVRGYGQHAAAIVVSKEAIGTSGRCNLRIQEGLPIVNWEKEDTEYVGLMKLDALGLKLLSILSETKRLIKENLRRNIDLEKINLNDKAVFKEISAGRTVGVFQLGTYAMTALIKEMGIETFNHMSDAVALVRPGPANSGMTSEYIKRKHGASWEPMHEIYEEITKDTYGLLVYQEQVMQVISRMANLPYSTADKVRKIIGKKRNPKEFKKYKDMFIKGCKKTGYFRGNEAEKFWIGLEKWASYGFNRAHSVEYAMLAYWCSWLKKYYPVEFICASLTYGAENKKKEILEEAYKLGLTIMLPKIGRSHATEWRAIEGRLYVPFVEVKGIGKVKAVEAAANKPTENNQDITKFFRKNNQAIRQKVGKIGGAFGKLLDKIGAYEEKNPAITPELRELFNFRLSNNPKKEYKRLYNLFQGDLRLDQLDDALEAKPAMLRELVKRIKPLRRTHIIKKSSFAGHRKLRLCHGCHLRQECMAPVAPNPGQYNVMIIGEAPGVDEENDRKGFVGRSGKKVWTSLKGYPRELFHVTNIAKCYPSRSKKPNPEQIAKCANTWLAKEIDSVAPKVILAFGNTGLQFFRNQKTGIMNMSGKVIWNEHYGCWIVYCLHPAATLHNPDNKVYYDTGMKRFREMLRILGVPKNRSKRL